MSNGESTSGSGTSATEQPAGRRIKWTIRPMKHEDINQCLRIWSQVDLTEAYQTVASALSADPGGFYVAQLNETDDVIGMCAGSMTRSDTAFMGFYAVEPQYQRIGIGRELWSKTLARLEPSINVGLYGVPSMSEKYKKSGFVIEDSTRMLIFESERGSAKERLNLKALKDIDELIGCRLEVINGESSDNMFRKLVNYDQTVQRFSREQLLRLYLTGGDVPLTLVVVKDTSRSKLSNDQQQHGSYHHGERKSSCCAKPSQEAIIEDETLSSTIKSSLSISASNSELLLRSSSPIDIPSVVSSTTTSNTTMGNDFAQQQDVGFEILGYGCIKHDNNCGGMIGPIYSDSSDVCEVILRNLMDRFELKSANIFSVMALSSNKQACKILTKVGLNEMEQCSRMFTKFVPAASFSKIYYVHSPNFTLF